MAIVATIPVVFPGPTGESKNGASSNHGRHIEGRGKGNPGRGGGYIHILAFWLKCFFQVFLAFSLPLIVGVFHSACVQILRRIRSSDCQDVMVRQYKQAIDQDEFDNMGRVTVLAMQGLRLLQLGACEVVLPLQGEEVVHPGGCHGSFKSRPRELAGQEARASPPLPEPAADNPVRDEAQRPARVTAQSGREYSLLASSPSEWTIVGRRGKTTRSRQGGQAGHSQADQGHRQRAQSHPRVHANYERGTDEEERRAQSAIDVSETSGNAHRRMQGCFDTWQESARHGDASQSTVRSSRDGGATVRHNEGGRVAGLGAGTSHATGRLRKDVPRQDEGGNGADGHSDANRGRCASRERCRVPDVNDPIVRRPDGDFKSMPAATTAAAATAAPATGTTAANGITRTGWFQRYGGRQSFRHAVGHGADQRNFYERRGDPEHAWSFTSTDFATDGGTNRDGRNGLGYLIVATFVMLLVFIVAVSVPFRSVGNLGRSPSVSGNKRHDDHNNVSAVRIALANSIPEPLPVQRWTITLYSALWPVDEADSACARTTDVPSCFESEVRRLRAIATISELKKHVAFAEQVLPAKAKGGLRFVSYNVCTLNPGELRQAEQMDPFTIRSGLLQIIFHDASVDVACVQETRLPGDSEQQGAYYNIRSAGATDRGQQGVQIWTAHAHAGGILTSIAFSPRLLLNVQWLHACLFAFLGCYGPTEDSDEAAKDAFWKDVQKAVQFVRLNFKDAIVVLLGDFNARVGSMTSDSIYDSCPEIENSNGARLRHFADESRVVAANTIHGGGPTWFSGRNQTSGHRLDYFLLDRSALKVCHMCCPAPSLELPSAVKIDHLPVVLDTVGDLDTMPGLCEGGLKRLASPTRQPKSQKRVSKINKRAMNDTCKMLEFQKQMLYIEKKVMAIAVRGVSDIDARYKTWCEGLRSSAAHVFGTEKTLPRQPWMSMRSWEVVQHFASLRRLAFRNRTWARSFVTRTLLHRWLLVRRRRESLNITKYEYDAHVDDLLDIDRGVVCYVSHRYLIDEHTCLRRLYLLKKAVNTSLNADRLAFLESMAKEAVQVNRLNDSKGVYRIIRLLAGERLKPLPGLRGTDGQLVTSPDGINNVWMDHFVKVFGARVCPLRDIRPDDPGTRGVLPPVVFKEETVERAITKLANGKGLGPDGNEAEIVKAAAPVSNRVMTAILNDVGEYHYVPVAMRGGKISELYKGKGDSKDTNNYRGLLLSDHQTKILTGILQDEVSDAYYSYIHAEQFGAAKKRGTDFAAHITSSFIQ